MDGVLSNRTSTLEDSSYRTCVSGTAVPGRLIKITDYCESGKKGEKRGGGERANRTQPFKLPPSFSKEHAITHTCGLEHKQSEEPTQACTGIDSRSVPLIKDH